MAMAPLFLMSFMEILLVPGGAGILGMPPAERDAKMLQVAPADSLIYLEWAARSEGKPGAKGIDGFMADPEIKALLKALDRNIAATIKRETARGRAEEQALAGLYPLAKLLIQHPGCLYAKYDSAFAKKILENGGRPDMLMFGVRAALVINGRTDIAAIEKQIISILAAAPGDGPGEKLDNYVVPTGLPQEVPQLMLHRHKSYIIVAFGKDTLADAISGLEGKRSGLGTNARFAARVKPLLMDRTGQVTWVDLKGAMAQAKTILGEKANQIFGMAKLLGLDGLDSSVSVVGVDDRGRVVTKGDIKTGGKLTGVFSLFSGKPLTKQTFQRIPADSDLVISVSLNLKAALGEVRRILKAVDPDTAEILEQDFAEIEKELGGIKIDEIFDAFGDRWVIHDSPSGGGVLVTSLVASLEVKDAKKGYQVFSQLMKVLNKVLPGEMEGGGRRRRGVFLANQKFLDRSIYFINIVGDDDIPFAPAFCITDSELLIAPTPVALKAHLRWAAKKKKRTFADRLGNGAEQVDFPAGEHVAFAYFNARATTRLLYAIVPYVGQMGLSDAQGWGEWDMTVFDIPSARALLPYISNGIASFSRTKDGFRSESKGGLPIPGGSTVIFAAPVVMGALFLVARPVEKFDRIGPKIRAIEKRQIELPPLRGQIQPFNNIKRLAN